MTRGPRIETQEKPEKHLKGRLFAISGAVAVASVTALMSQGGDDAAKISTPSVNEIVHEATTGHYARAQGVGDELHETGTPLSQTLSGHLDRLEDVMEDRRTPETAVSIDMNYSAGAVSAREGEWTPERLEGYIDRIDQMSAALETTLSDDDTHDAVSWRVGAAVAILQERGIAPSIEGDNPVFEGALNETRRLMDGVDEFAYRWAWETSAAPDETPEEQTYGSVVLDF